MTGGSGGGGFGGAGTGGLGGAGTGGIGGIGGYPGDGGCGANPPSIPCPETPPPVGEACPVNTDPCFSIWWGTTCSYADPCGGTTPLELDCSGPTWQVISGSLTCETCPSTQPSVGTACSVSPNQVCSFFVGCCSLDYSCTGGVWTVAPNICNPPIPICPNTPPDPGSACDPTGCSTPTDCSWDTCATLGKMTNATCVGGTWSVSGAPCAADAGTP